jgi:16S rRNA U516 pseudouridylate synthase RsuA-like enzyme
MMTDGDLGRWQMHPRHEVDKVYEVIVMGTPDPRAVEKLPQGVYIEGGRTSPAQSSTSAARSRGRNQRPS